MPRLTQQEIRSNAISFVHEWKDESHERAESQTFWNEFLEIFGVKRRQVAVERVEVLKQLRELTGKDKISSIIV